MSHIHSAFDSYAYIIVHSLYLFLHYDKGWSSECKLRLCAFHMILKPWLKLSTNDENQQVLSTVLTWILSWFRYVENESEYRVSRDSLMRYLKSNETVIALTNMRIIQNILSAIAVNEESCLHFHFLSSSTFLFISDSIVEGQNGLLREKINANCSLSLSTEIQTNMTRASFQKKQT